MEIRKRKGVRLRERARHMELNPTPAEARLLAALSAAGFPYEFQKPLLGYIPDFQFPTGLIVEVDGSSHDGLIRHRKDLRRDRRLYNRGYDTLRILNREVYEDPERCLYLIWKRMNPKRRPVGWVPSAQLIARCEAVVHGLPGRRDPSLTTGVDESRQARGKARPRALTG